MIVNSRGIRNLIYKNVVCLCLAVVLFFLLGNSSQAAESAEYTMIIQENEKNTRGVNESGIISLSGACYARYDITSYIQ